MQPEYKIFPKKILVGLAAEFASTEAMDADGMTVIPALWNQFNERRKEIKSPLKSNSSYGAIYHEGSGMAYMACMEVGDTNFVPRSMRVLTIPPGKYACFLHKGPISTIRETMIAIYGGWVPANEEKMRDSPHLEIYDERFISPTSEKSIVEVCVPVKEGRTP